ncbi:MAG TPA: YdeI/OmpD-associated family protein [Oligoflexus sp.]|uniref:YdeI/OmpD-associated family protein n=1 Tax=Oligoflexus sp. TaxID=1971216 RepID=UPI002D7EBE37|nr:YdeI/OmpD-associated family protein [Oligoflexus sp.]HET9238252.1 YdeI/OmpD-associated family protein [Oligoflexus sp.]
MHSEVDSFIRKAKQWKEEIETLRAIVLSAKLDEDFKWSKPCYTHEARNIAIIQPFNGCLGFMFFKGELLKDPKGVLKDNGPNSQSARRMEFTSSAEITRLKATIRAYIKEAVAIEESGQKVAVKKNPEPVPEELKEFFKKKPALKKAFEALTPGRQRAYILHFSSAKQSETRRSRIEKCMALILEGKGLNDR